MYRVHLTNFGYDVYVGDNLTHARAATVKAGFESVIYQHTQPILCYSPISGWRGLVS
jgi:hypothetical protein